MCRHMATRSVTNAWKSMPAFGASICVRDLHTRHRGRMKCYTVLGILNLLAYRRERTIRCRTPANLRIFFWREDKSFQNDEVQRLFSRSSGRNTEGRAASQLIYITGCVNIVIKISKIEKGNFPGPRDDLLRSCAAYLWHSCKHYSAHGHRNNNTDRNVTRRWIRKITFCIV